MVEMMPKKFFTAMLQGLLVAEEPEQVMELIVSHIQEYGFQRFCEGMDFEGQCINGFAQTFDHEKGLVLESEQVSA